MNKDQKKMNTFLIIGMLLCFIVSFILSYQHLKNMNQTNAVPSYQTILAEDAREPIHVNQDETLRADSCISPPECFYH